MSKKRKRLGQAEAFGLSIDETLAEKIDKAILPMGCQRCFRENNQMHYHHWSDPDKRLCVECYNIVAEQHRPPSKRK